MDKAISQALRQFRAEGTWPEDLSKLALKLASKGYKFSYYWPQAIQQPGRWPKDDDGFQPLDSHYYKEPPSEEDLADANARIRSSVSNFMASDTPALLASFDRANWDGPRGPEEYPPWFMAEDMPVYASLDFAIRTGECTHIFDWKTGPRGFRKGESASAQLHGYALYAMYEWGVPLDAIRLYVVWLQPGHEREEVPLTREGVEAAKADFREVYDALVRKLDGLTAQTLVVDQWPCSTSEWACSRCTLRGCCMALRQRTGGLGGEPR